MGEKVKSRGYEVSYVSEPVDEMTLQNIERFMDKQIVDIGKESQDDLSEDEKKEKEQKNEDFEGLRTWMTKVLDGKIIRVEVSTRLVDSPATLVQVSMVSLRICRSIFAHRLWLKRITKANSPTSLIKQCSK